MKKVSSLFTLAFTSFLYLLVPGLVNAQATGSAIPQQVTTISPIPTDTGVPTVAATSSGPVTALANFPVDWRIFATLAAILLFLLLIALTSRRRAPRDYRQSVSYHDISPRGRNEYRERQTWQSENPENPLGPDDPTR